MSEETVVDKWENLFMDIRSTSQVDVFCVPAFQNISDYEEEYRYLNEDYALFQNKPAQVFVFNCIGSLLDILEKKPPDREKLIQEVTRLLVETQEWFAKNAPGAREEYKYGILHLILDLVTIYMNHVHMKIYFCAVVYDILQNLNNEDVDMKLFYDNAALQDIVEYCITILERYPSKTPQEHIDKSIRMYSTKFARSFCRLMNDECRSNQQATVKEESQKEQAEKGSRGEKVKQSLVIVGCAIVIAVTGILIGWLLGRKANPYAEENQKQMEEIEALNDRGEELENSEGIIIPQNVDD